MASASFYHDTRRTKKDLLCPLRITLRHHQTAAQIPLDVELSPTQWNGHAVQNHPNEKTHNVILTKKDGRRPEHHAPSDERPQGQLP